MRFQKSLKKGKAFHSFTTVILEQEPGKIKPGRLLIAKGGDQHGVIRFLYFLPR